MKRRVRDEFKGFSHAWVGWLFADMFLILGMIFLLAAPDITALPSSSAQAENVTPTPMTGNLELNYCLFTITINDPERVSTDMQYAISELEPKIRMQPILQNRQVGIALVGAGTENDAQREMAWAIGKQVYKVFQYLGNQNFAFNKASYYNVLSYRDSHLNTIFVDVYLVVQPDRKGDTCDKMYHQPI